MCKKEVHYKMLVKTINQRIKKYGVEVMYRKNEQGKYDVGYELIANRKITWTKKNITLGELGAEVNNAWELAEKQGKVITKLYYIVTAVTMSESEYDANGYCNSSVFDTLDKARQKKDQYAFDEKQYRESEEMEYEILEDNEMEFRMGWCDNTEQFRVTIHEVVMNI